MRQTHLPYDPWPRWLPSMSDTHTSGLGGAEQRLTTALPRLGRMMCSTASVPTNTHSHQFLPLTRAEVSSEQTTGLASTDRADRCRCGQQRLTRAGQHVADRTLADRQREELVHQQGQPFHADGMGVVQIDHHRGDRAGRRAILAPVRAGRRRSPARRSRRNDRRTGAPASHPA